MCVCLLATAISSTNHASTLMIYLNAGNCSCLIINLIDLKKTCFALFLGCYTCCVNCQAQQLTQSVCITQAQTLWPMQWCYSLYCAGETVPHPICGVQFNLSKFSRSFFSNANMSNCVHRAETLCEGCSAALYDHTAPSRSCDDQHTFKYMCGIQNL